MQTLVFILVFALGTIIGSFLNVVIYRFNTGRTAIKGRSICMTCSHTLRWYELIPVFSFLIQSGKCRRCAGSISHQYPLVELGTGLIFALLAFHFLPFLYLSHVSYVFLLAFFSLVFSLLMVISVYDIRHKIIPDKLVYLYAFVSFLTLFVNHSTIGELFKTPTLGWILSGPLFALPFALLWLISRGRWMGLGDAKLMLGIGWMLGPAKGLAAVMIAFWLGAIASLFLLFFSNKKMTMKTEIPFAPFLILGTLIVFFIGFDIFYLSSFFRF